MKPLQATIMVSDHGLYINKPLKGAYGSEQKAISALNGLRHSSPEDQAAKLSCDSLSLGRQVCRNQRS